MTGGAIALGLTAVAVISSTMLQGSVSEHPLQTRAHVNQLPNIVETQPSSAVDTHAAVKDALAVTRGDAGAELPTAPSADRAGQTGTNAAHTTTATPEAPPPPAYKRAPKASPKPTSPGAAPRRPDPSVYDQYP